MNAAGIIALVCFITVLFILAAFIFLLAFTGTKTNPYDEWEDENNWGS